MEQIVQKAYPHLGDLIFNIYLLETFFQAGWPLQPSAEGATLLK